jgi:hypothetical protein
MSSIPPNSLASIIGAQGTQRRGVESAAADAHDAARRAGKAERPERSQDVIEQLDRDDGVYADAEGTGSKGRPFGEAQAEEAESAGDGEAPSGSTSGGSVDLQA